MKMKKNTKFSLHDSASSEIIRPPKINRTADIIVISLCVIGALLNIRLFLKDLNAAFSKLNEEPIATISWKYKISQRRLSDRFIWDRLRQDAPIYSGDTIRTADQATATIYFVDKNVIELGANTIVQVYSDNDGAAVDFGGGDVFVDTSSSSGMTLRSGNAAVTLDGGSSLSAQGGASVSDGTPFNVQLIAGHASLAGTSEAVALSQGSAVIVGENGEVSAPEITIKSPLPSARLLNFNAKPTLGGALINESDILVASGKDEVTPVSFSWETKAPSVVLETSRTKDFKELSEQFTFSNINSVSLSLPSGVNYWRIYSQENNVPDMSNAVSGCLHILDAPQPQAIVPAEGDHFKYRRRTPSIRFMWNGNEYVSSYLFEIADNKSMNNPVISQRTTYPSAIVASLERGKWFWRVTPYYSLNNTGYGAASEVISFDIEQSGDLRAPHLLQPDINGFVNTAVSAEGSPYETIFSWEADREAVSYTIRIAKDSSFNDVVAERTVLTNWYTSIPAKDTISDGRWYWSVKQTDTEGNSSSYSQARSFTAVEGDVQFGTVFPQEGYKIADSRIIDTRFTWKKNIPYDIHFQIASDTSFSSPIVDKFMSESSLSTTGVVLPIGTWYWRIVTVSDDNSEPLETSPKSFQVVPPLATPTILYPNTDERTTAYPAESVKFSWMPVKDADYYQVTLYPENSETAIYQNQNVEGTVLPIKMDNFPNGNYRWSIQAFADETLYSSRRTGLISEVSFSLRKLYPIVLKEPENDAIYQGLQAYLNPASLSWKTREPIEQGEIIITSSADSLPSLHGAKIGSDVVYKVAVPQDEVSSITLPSLMAGTYWWRVTGLIEDGYDVSSVQRYKFTVLPIEPLPMSVGLEPIAETVFGAEYLINSSAIALKWNAVSGANAYLLKVVYANTGKTIIFTEIPATTSTNMQDSSLPLSYTIEDISVFDEGSFEWTVEAIKRMENGDLLQHGVPAKSSFAIKLPPVPNFELLDLGDFYGN